MALDPVALLKGMVAFPSLSHEEGPLADWVEALVKACGVSCQRIDDNVIFWIGEGPRTLLLNSHLDVVPPSEGHPYDPFTPTEREGHLYGRGTVDAKASGASMMAALLQLAQAGYAPPDGRVMVALTACEETSGYNGLEAIRPQLPDLSAALVGEPTALQPCIAQKGLLILKLIAHGRAAHAGRAHLGQNAIHLLMEDLQRLRALSLPGEDPLLGPCTLTPTVVSGGDANNAVPDRCTATLDIRSTPSTTHAALIATVTQAVQSEVVVHSERLVPVATAPEEPIVQACQAAVSEASPFGSPTASDWIFLSDVPTVKIGPGLSERSHTAEEHINLAEVTRAVEVYRKIITAYFTQDIS
ncbi:MAG: M20/M25/M40 family metallo-hydrolase [Bacteroidetes bacterium]|nr:M20/M25/M40 family metallo-hydrolase [Bacteroidota bacterium]